MNIVGIFVNNTYHGKMIDTEKALEAVVEAAKKAGDRIMQDFGTAVEASEKGDPADRVSQVDRDSEEIIRTHLQQTFPDIAFLGEEDESSTGNMQGYMWIVDPLDGTANFLQGLENMGVSIALWNGMEPVLGVLYFPAKNLLYTAIKGAGAECNGKSIQVKDCAKLEQACIAEIFSDREHRNSQVLYPRCRCFRKFGSAITSQGYVAHGAVQATALICYIWDIAAGYLIMQEAGATVQYDFSEPENIRSPLELIAAVPGIFAAFENEIRTNYYTKS